MPDNYNWDTPSLIQGGNPVTFGSEFGKNTNNGNSMQPDAYYSDMFLERKRFKGDDFVFASYAETRTIKKGLDTINLRRYQPLKAHIVPLVEGLPPIGDRAHGKAIIAKTRQYGRFMEFTDLFEYKVADPVIEEYTVELADLVNETIDMLAQAALLAEAQTFFPVASKATDKDSLVKAAVADKAKDDEHKTAVPRFKDLRVIALTMEVAKVKSIGGSYPVLASPAVYFDLQTDPDVVHFMERGQTNAAMSANNIPSIYNLSIRKAQTAKSESVTVTGTDGGTAVVHHTLVLGAKAFSKIEIGDGGNHQFFAKGLGSAGGLDPLNQRRTMGWKIMALGFKVTDPDAVVDYMTVPTQAEIITDNFDYVTDIAGEIGITEKMLMAKIADISTGTATAPAATEALAKAALLKSISEVAKVSDGSIVELVGKQFTNLKDSTGAANTDKTVATRDKNAKAVETAKESA